MYCRLCLEHALALLTLHQTFVGLVFVILRYIEIYLSEDL